MTTYQHPPKAPKKVHRMTPPTLISVVNESKRLSDADAEAMTLAVGKQLTQHVAPMWGPVPAVEFVKKGGTPTPGGCLCTISDEPDVPNAGGYHDEDASGPFIKVFVSPTLDNGGTALHGSNSVSVTLSHECAELVGDSPANRWVDGPSGHDFALELADPVEGDSYVVDGVSVSNFVLPAFFDPHAEAGSKLDYLGKLRTPFTMTPGGYQITRTEPGQVSQIFAEDHESSEIAPGLHIHFGPDFPEWRKGAKVAKAKKRRARRHP